MATLSLSGEPCSACWTCVCMRALICVYISFDMGQACASAPRLPQALYQVSPVRRLTEAGSGLDVSYVVKAADVVAHCLPGFCRFAPLQGVDDFPVFTADHFCRFFPVLQACVGFDHLPVDGGPEGPHQVGGEGVAGGFGNPDVEGRIKPVELGRADVGVIHPVQDQAQFPVVLLGGPSRGFLAAPGLQRNAGFEYFGGVELAECQLEVEEIDESRSWLAHQNCSPVRAS